LARRVRERTAELTAALAGVAQAYSSTLAALVHALDAREHETSDHSQRVVRYTLAIAERMGIAHVEDIGRGALLHDIGKIGVPDSILLKPGPLTHAEWAEMRRHPEVGYRILEAIDFLRPAAEIVLAHQERWDGGGYPRKLRGAAIPLGARAAKAVLVRAKDAEVQGWLLRIAVVGGGCNGLTYDLYFVESARPDDAVVDVQGLRIAVDPISVPLLDGTIIDLPRGPGF